MSTPSPIPPLESPSKTRETRQMRETGPALTGRLPADLRPYLAVNAMLVVIWAATGAGYFWPIWPILGWGIGLLANRGSTNSCGALFWSPTPRQRSDAPRTPQDVRRG